MTTFTLTDAETGLVVVATDDAALFVGLFDETGNGEIKTAGNTDHVTRVGIVPLSMHAKLG